LFRQVSEPPPIEAAYRIENGRNRTFSLAGDAALNRATAQETGEAMTVFRSAA
jgi:hypothetical protein